MYIVTRLCFTIAELQRSASRYPCLNKLHNLTSSDLLHFTYTRQDKLSRPRRLKVAFFKVLSCVRKPADISEIALESLCPKHYLGLSKLAFFGRIGLG